MFRKPMPQAVIVPPMPKRETSADLHAFSKELIRRWEASDRPAYELAKKAGVSAGFLSQVKSDRARMGLGPLTLLGEAFGYDLAQLVNLAHAFATNTEPQDMSIDIDSTEPRLSNLEGWDAAELEARRRFKHIPEPAWIAVRNIRTASPPRVLTSDWIGAIASDWARALEAPDE